MTRHPLKQYTRSRTHGVTSMGLIAQIFERCAHHAHAMAHSMSDGHEYKRFQHCEKIVYAMTHCVPILNDALEDQADFQNELQSFYTHIMSSLTEANQKKKADLCFHIETLFTEFAHSWKNL